MGNIRLTFNSLLEKAQGRERERQREDARRLKKQEQAFCDMLHQAGEPTIRTDTQWEEIVERFSTHPAFLVSKIILAGASSFGFIVKCVY